MIAPGLELHVISVDLCLQREEGNLLAPDAHVFWQRQHVDRSSGQAEALRVRLILRRDFRTMALVHYVMQIILLVFQRCAKNEWNQVLVGTRLLHFILDQLLLLAHCGSLGFCL